ncbi:hypothetical protein Avbf_08467 [Armadillidium vulgare]|nr:hypothetical protein Avbf_08467 [Armadillidium vulgare]
MKPRYLEAFSKKFKIHSVIMKIRKFLMNFITYPKILFMISGKFPKSSEYTTITKCLLSKYPSL